MVRFGSHALKMASLFLLLIFAILLSVPGCSPSETPLQTIVMGEQVTADDNPTGEPSSAVQPSLVIDNITVVGSLIRGQQCFIEVSCLVNDVDGTVQSVKADLSAAGGPGDVMLKGNGKLWVWSGFVTATVAGSAMVYFTATDDRSAVSTQATSLVVIDDQSPYLSNVTAIGNLIVGQAGTLTVSCDASSGVDLRSVTADLSAMGGSSSQPLASTGSLWTWSGTVRPATAGPAIVVLTAVDTSSSARTYATEIAVAEDGRSGPGGSSESAAVKDLNVTGLLIQGQSGNVIVSCRPSGAGGPLQSVYADLTPLGGPASQSLAYDGVCWIWSGTLTPPAGGAPLVVFTATDSAGVTTTARIAAGVADPRVTMTIPGVTKPATGPTWIEVNRLVQGEACSVKLACSASATGVSAQSVVVNLSEVGGAAAQPMAWNGSQWTWSGTLTPPEDGIKQITLTGTDSSGGTTILSTTVGVKDSQVLRANWMLVMPDSSWSSTEPYHTQYVDALVSNIEKSRVPVVMLYNSLWDWRTGVMYNGKVLAGGSFSQAQVMRLVDRLRSIPGITVGFHCCPTVGLDGRSTSDRDLAWLLGDAEHPGGIEKLTRLNAKVAYADGSTWKTIAIYEQSLRSGLGPNGILAEGDIGVYGIQLEGNSHLRNIDGCSTRDQCDPVHVYYLTHMKQYADWRIATMDYYKTFVPAWARYEIGWIGEWDHYDILPPAANVPLLPQGQYEYIFRRARESGIPLTFRTPAEWLGRRSDPQNDQRLQRIGELAQVSPILPTVGRAWSAVAMSATGAIQVTAAYSGRLFLSADSGLTWAEQMPAGNADKDWNCAAVSGDGMRVVAGVWNGRLYTGARSGTTGTWVWSEILPAGAADMCWQGLAISVDGLKIVARPLGRIAYVSSNGGSTWQTIQLPGKGDDYDNMTWSSLAMSSDGNVLLLADDVLVQRSLDFGATWTSAGPRPASGNARGKSCVAMSSTGDRMVCGAWPDRVYVSQNKGTAWAETQPAGDMDQYWQCAAMSSNGARTVVGAWPGRLYRTSNAGATWNELQPAGDVDRNWESVAVSGDGTRILVTDGNQIYFSADSGATWLMPAMP